MITITYCRWKATLVLFFCFLFIPFSSYGNGKNDNILVINSYTEEFVWSEYVFDAIRNSLVDKASDVGVQIESLNMLLMTDKEVLIKRKKEILNKVQSNLPEVIVLQGNLALLTFLDELHTIWKGIPVIFCADNNSIVSLESYLSKVYSPTEKEYLLEDLVKGLNITIVNCPVYMEETVKMMTHLLPEMKKLVFISDRRYISARMRCRMEKVMKEKFPHLELSQLVEGEVSTEMMLDSIRSYDMKEVGILYYSWILGKGGPGSGYLSTSNHRVVANITPHPVFTLLDLGIHTDEMAGGYLYCGYEMGKTVADILDTMLYRPQPSAVRWREAGKPRYAFCYNVLQAGGISPKLYPSDAVYYFAPVSYWMRYRYTFIGFGVLLILLGILLMRLRLLNKVEAHRKKEFRLLAQYKVLFDNMPIVVCKYRLLYDKVGNAIDYVLEEANDLYVSSKVGPKFPVGSKGSDIEGDKAYWGDTTSYLGIFKEVLQCRQPYSFEYKHEISNSFYELKVVPGADENDVCMYVIDVTRVHRAQNMLESVNHKLAMTLDVANLIPWKWDLKKKTILCDVKRPIELRDFRGDEDALSVPEAEYFSKIHKEDRERVENAFMALLEGRIETIKEEYRVLVSANGHTSFEWVEAQAAVDMRDEDGTPLTLIGSSVAITQRKMMELELLEAKERAEESNRLKSAFLANMSHEIRTPLNAIVGFSNILLDAEEPEEKEEYAHIIENNNTLLLQLINDILDLSKIEAGTLEFVYTDFNLNGVMRELEQMFVFRLNDRPIEILCTTPIPFCYIHSEKNRLTQVMINMMTNAMKFTERGSISLGYRLQEDGMLYFYVADTGCGIPHDKKETVFGRFVKLDSFQQGTGLGLSICEMIVHKLGGRIGVDSVLGEGSKFWFTVPYNPVKISSGEAGGASSDEEDMDAKTKEVVSKNKLKILIAEDTDSNYKLFASILKNEYQLIHASNGREAVELFCKEHPHLIIMDINMPVLNGYEAVEEIRKISSAVPIIAVTAYAFDSDEQRILHSGFNAYASKPINANALKNKILSLLEKRMILL